MRGTISTGEELDPGGLTNPVGLSHEILMGRFRWEFEYLFGFGMRPEWMDLSNIDLRPHFQKRNGDKQPITHFSAFVHAPETGAFAVLDADNLSAQGITLNPITGAVAGAPYHHVQLFITGHTASGGTITSYPLYMQRVNHAPEATKQFANTAILHGDAVTINLNDHFSDANGDELTFRVKLKVAGQRVVTLKNTGDSAYGLTLDAEAGTVTGMPTEDVRVRVTARDDTTRTKGNQFKLVTLREPAERRIEEDGFLRLALDDLQFKTFDGSSVTAFRFADSNPGHLYLRGGGTTRPIMPDEAVSLAAIAAGRVWWRPDTNVFGTFTLHFDAADTPTGAATQVATAPITIRVNEAPSTRNDVDPSVLKLGEGPGNLSRLQDDTPPPDSDSNAGEPAIIAIQPKVAPPSSFAVATARMAIKKATGQSLGIDGLTAQDDVEEILIKVFDYGSYLFFGPFPVGTAQIFEGMGIAVVGSYRLIKSFVTGHRGSSDNQTNADGHSYKARWGAYHKEHESTGGTFNASWQKDEHAPEMVLTKSWDQNVASGAAIVPISFADAFRDQDEIIHFRVHHQWGGSLNMMRNLETGYTRDAAALANDWSVTDNIRYSFIKRGMDFYPDKGVLTFTPRLSFNLDAQYRDFWKSVGLELAAYDGIGNRLWSHQLELREPSGFVGFEQNAVNLNKLLLQSRVQHMATNPEDYVVRWYSVDFFTPGESAPALPTPHNWRMLYRNDLPFNLPRLHGETHHAGLTFNHATGELAGTPTKTVNVRVTFWELNDIAAMWGSSAPRGVEIGHFGPRPFEWGVSWSIDRKFFETVQYASKTVTIVVERPPVLESHLGNTILDQGNDVNHRVDIFSDPNDDIQSYGIRLAGTPRPDADDATARLENGLYLELVNGTLYLRGVPTDDATFIITAYDKAGYATDSNPVTIDINHAPIVTPVTENTIFTSRLNIDTSAWFSDPDGDPLTFTLITSDPNLSLSDDGQVSGSPSGVVADFRIQASDPRGLTVTSQTVRIVNLESSAMPTTMEDSALRVDASHFLAFNRAEPLTRNFQLLDIEGGSLIRKVPSGKAGGGFSETIIAASNGSDGDKGGKLEEVIRISLHDLLAGQLWFKPDPNTYGYGHLEIQQDGRKPQQLLIKIIPDVKAEDQPTRMVAPIPEFTPHDTASDQDNDDLAPAVADII